MEIIFPSPLDLDLRRHLFASREETCALLITSPALRGGRSRHLVRAAFLPIEADYVSRSPAHAALQPAFYVPIVTRPAREHAGIAFVHSHPFADNHLAFSAVDDEGERALALYLERRVPDTDAFAIVYSPTRRVARHLATDRLIPSTTVGSTIEQDEQGVTTHDGSFDRQVRAFGETGQLRIRQLRVGIVGLGGTGSLLAQQLAFLGVREFVLIDPDQVETSNANRVIGATAEAIGRAKVDIAAEVIGSIRSDASVQRVQANILQASSTEVVLGCDFIFSCTDSHGSRALLNQIAYQYLIPCIDMGVAIGTKGGVVTGITGRVQMLAPGLPCLVCGALLDPEAVRLDFLPEAQRQLEPYFIGDGVPQPAVISINGIVASLAVTMFLSAVAGVPSPPRLLFYDGIRGAVRPTICNVVADCIICSASRGALAQGDLWPLPSLQA